MTVRAKSGVEGFGGTMIVVLFLIGAVLTLGLYFVKTQAQSAKTDAARLEAAVNNASEEVRVLRAELALLSSPDRLAELGEERLGLQPTVIEQTISLRDIENRFELRDSVGGEP